MWVKFLINIHLICSFLVLCIFFIKKSLLWQNQIIIWMTCFFRHILVIFFLLSSIWGTFTCCHYGSTWLIFSIQQVAHFEHTLRSIKLCVYNCVSHYFLHRSGNSEVYFFIYVYETVPYFLWIRNTRLTAELWLQDQNENLLLCVNKMLCWKLLQQTRWKWRIFSWKSIHRWRWYRWWLWIGEWKWQQWGRKWTWCDQGRMRNWTNWRKRRRYGKYCGSINIKWIHKFDNNSTETKVQNSWWCSKS